ncbi:hypothetical protein ASPSYDRAFT_62281 [Aspergillus sydowii CBS 593.65]|uniref:Methyltransferase domain-containing protein n=1 Tax=Aspergillus sydowii CBS 593.65 TaxID=1036612 RepID=A0A1L9T104_9EURO|nr:uncharacterized protein ASPSYDRAFT_62281 [Aspergillus sydowii CBS 593.65]OJJ53089.1 hypothetical protein ASPSYDRAFT_62281 [Aspergillus sydowii CBS 593.65]
MNLRTLFGKQPTNKSLVYGLDHAILNTPIPPPSMWMNLGYWKDTSDFPTACAALLDQVLITASLIDEDGDAKPHLAQKKLRLLDVGIGCGDQSLRILGYKKRGENSSAEVKEKSIDEPKAPLFESYVGVTSLPVQAEFASQRIEHSFPSPSLSEEVESNDAKTTPRAQIFCADAANPSSWPSELHTSLKEEEDEGGTENWLLALDTLYHFHPSRTPLFKYTYSTLHASIMTFDLLLPSSPRLSLWTRLLLRILCLFSGTPYSNFHTEEEYTALLVAAGYDIEKIVLRDISEDVFAGIAGFCQRRGEVVSAYAWQTSPDCLIRALLANHEPAL